LVDLNFWLTRNRRHATRFDDSSLDGRGRYPDLCALRMAVGGGDFFYDLVFVFLNRSRSSRASVPAVYARCTFGPEEIYEEVRGYAEPGDTASANFVLMTAT